MSFSDYKAEARRAVHAALAVPCRYNGPGGATVADLTARFHDRKVIGGDLGGGYASVIEGVTRVIFNREELATKNVTLRQRGRVTFAQYGMTFELGTRDPYDGPITEAWSISPVSR